MTTASRQNFAVDAGGGEGPRTSLYVCPQGWRSATVSDLQCWAALLLVKMTLIVVYPAAGIALHLDPCFESNEFTLKAWQLSASLFSSFLFVLQKQW